MPARPSSAFFTGSASSCCAATLLADRGTALGLPGTRPYHLPDFFFTFLAPGVPLGTLRALTKRAPGASFSQGLPSGPTQQSRSQYWTTVTLNRPLAISSSLSLVGGLGRQVQPQVGAQPGGGRQGQGPLGAQEARQLRLVHAGRPGQPVEAQPAAGDGPPQLLRQVRGPVRLRHLYSSRPPRRGTPPNPTAGGLCCQVTPLSFSPCPSVLLAPPAQAAPASEAPGCRLGSGPSR